jgi:pantoate--beta-alanine ligase
VAGVTVEVVRTVGEVRSWRAACDRSAGGRAEVGLVPTMGYLHEGHLSLVRRAAEENPCVAASVFVNPTQFGPDEDLAAYPRDLPRDVALLAEAGCQLVFAPEPGEVYLPGHQAWVEPGHVAQPLEGAHRPGHFRGVATVVLKLFGIVEPTRAYFGRKDAQQLAVINTMVRDLNVPVRIVACPTVREPDGLAMSSRNTYLDTAEREAATVLHRALGAARDAWEAGERDAGRLRRIMRDVLASEPLARPDYVSVADPDTLAELEVVTGEVLLSMAVRIGKTRLIDNVVVGRDDPTYSTS